MYFRIGRDFSFDDGMAHRGCRVYSFDPTTGNPDHIHSERVLFLNTGLSDHDQEGDGTVAMDTDKAQWRTRTLASIIYELGHHEVGEDVCRLKSSITTNNN